MLTDEKWCQETLTRLGLTLTPLPHTGCQCRQRFLIAKPDNKTSNLTHCFYANNWEEIEAFLRGFILGCHQTTQAAEKVAPVKIETTALMEKAFPLPSVSATPHTSTWERFLGKIGYGKKEASQEKETS